MAPEVLEALTQPDFPSPVKPGLIERAGGSGNCHPQIQAGKARKSPSAAYFMTRKTESAASASPASFRTG
jgi:hypothetical protein